MEVLDGESSSTLQKIEEDQLVHRAKDADPFFPQLHRRPHALVFACGRGDLGQLGLGDEVGRDHPTLIKSFLDKDIIYIAASDFHSAFLTVEGELFVTGSNHSGQLGTTNVHETQLFPVRVEALATQKVSHVACGQCHTVAVTDTGALSSWGAAEFGQLGQRESAESVTVFPPRILKGTRELHFVRVACGATHTLALTGSGSVFSFGQGTFGALGHGNTESCNVPTFIEELWGIGITQIACGENHSVALSVDGQVFSWGRGKYGQLGHGTVQNQSEPMQVKALADQMIIHIVCGGDHTLALNSDGVLFSWGRGHWGQTGLGTLDDVIGPQQVQIPACEHIIQISAGVRHSIALSAEGKLFGWGDAEQGQLGRTESQVQLLPCVLSGFLQDGFEICYTVAGGEHTFAVYQQLSGSKLEHTSILKQAEGVSVASALGHTCDLQVSGLRPLNVPDLIQMLKQGGKSVKSTATLGYALEDVFSSARFTILYFKVQPSYWQNQIDYQGEGPGLDIEKIRCFYQHVLELYNPEIMKKLGSAMIRLFESIAKKMDFVPESRWTRVLLVGFQSPFIGERGLGDLVSTAIFSVFARLNASTRKTIEQWIRTYPRDVFGGRFVRGVLRYISIRKDALSSSHGIREDVIAALKVLSLLYEVNKVGSIIEITEFYSSAISENTDLQEEYLKWGRHHFGNGRQTFVSFCQFPFVLTPQAKSRILEIEAFIQKQQMINSSVVQQLFGNPFANPFLVLMVRRNNLVGDSLQQLLVHPVELKKPLKVVFEGEEGIDEGGVTKEFFQLLVHELFNVDYGMFTYNDETRNFWFNPNSMESEQEFQLVGTILGLAIYNGVILDVHLPLVAYKKLLGQKPKLEDLKDVQPHLARNLQHLLEYDNDVEVFCLVFEVMYDYFGELKSFELIPGGSDVPVTNENRERYVDLYVKYILEVSIEKQFSAFERGFQQVCGGPSLRLFHYEELELLVCGLPHFDFDALERVTIYQGGFTIESQVIKWFWEIVKEMTLEEKKSLLFFSTGNDRAPVGGLGSLKLIIQRMGDDSNRLPTAHTCFNLLLLPDYQSKSKLENRLKLAISNCTGFGLQ